MRADANFGLQSWANRENLHRLMRNLGYTTQATPMKKINLLDEQTNYPEATGIQLLLSQPQRLTKFLYNVKKMTESH